MSGHFLDNERLADLLTRQATEGLSEADQRELDQLLVEYPDADPMALETTAAALFLAGDWQEEPLPPAVRAKLDAAATGFNAAQMRVVAGSGLGAMSGNTATPASRTSRVAWLAAAASIVLAVAAWLPRLQEQQNEGIELLSQASLDTATLSQLRQQLLANTAPLQKEWTPTDDPAGQAVRGDVVWDPESQTGYMRFTGLPANDPQQLQYQLWIFDASRDERYPIDGGVFDIRSDGGEVVVPILAKLPVRNPTLFAVTIERPGGVVVSDREHIVAVASVGTG
jgi:Anti-sigma-K factor rskA